MPHTDLPLEQLRGFRPEVEQPADFDAFWTATLAESRAASADPVLDAVAGPITEVAVGDLSFSGFGGDPIRAWVTRPHGDEPRPAIVEFIGYGGGRGLPGERLQWAAAGYVHVLMDTRGQGSAWGSGGATPDPHGSGPAFPGVMTRGIESPQTYYYRRLFTDAVLLLDVVAGLPFVDATRIAVTGGSQGGAITIAAAALSPVPAGAMPDVPFLSHFRRSAELTPHAPFTELRDYLAVHRDRVEQVFATLAYFDGVNLARCVRIPTLFSVALMDEIVLPSTVFAAYNHLPAGDHDIAVYEFNGHEGGELHHWYRQHAWLGARFSR